MQTSRHPRTLARLGLRLLTGLLCMLAGAMALGYITASPARADTVGVNTFTWHDRDRPDGLRYEWFTPGVYYRADSGLTVGTLRNSYRRIGVYGAWTTSTDESRPLSAALTLGLTTGYDIAPVVPLIVPSVALRLSPQLAGRVLLMPKVHAKQHASAVSLALEWSL